MEKLTKQQKDAELDARMRRGEEAKTILGNQLLKHALGSMEREIIAAMKTLRPGDTEGRDTLWRELCAMQRFQTKLASYVMTGEQARKTLMQRIKEKF